MRLPKTEAYKSFYNILKKYLNDNITDFTYIYNELFKITGRYEISFTSKIINMVNNNLPIYDSKIFATINNLFVHELKKYKGSNQKEKYENGIALYSSLLKFYEDFIITDETENIIKIFDDAFPQFRNFSKV